MTREDFKQLLKELAEEEPDFLRDILGEVVKSSLSIDSVSNGDYYNPETTYQLKWKLSDQSEEAFSKAY